MGRLPASREGKGLHLSADRTEDSTSRRRNALGESALCRVKLAAFDLSTIMDGQRTWSEDQSCLQLWLLRIEPLLNEWGGMERGLPLPCLRTTNEQCLLIDGRAGSRGGEEGRRGREGEGGGA